MQMLAAAGIYVVADLGEPKNSINRDLPQWNEAIYQRYTAVVDNLAKYTNTLGFFAGNEVTNMANNTQASAFVKAAVRDVKAYIVQKKYRPLGVGYATNDDDQRTELAQYFNCGDPSASIDFWGYNIYSWCGQSSYRESHYQERTQEFSTYNVPVFFAEYGCNTEGAREFDEVAALYGNEMTKVWSGGIVYMYYQEANDYGQCPYRPAFARLNVGRSRVSGFGREGNQAPGLHRVVQSNRQSNSVRGCNVSVFTDQQASSLSQAKQRLGCE